LNNSGSEAADGGKAMHYAIKQSLIKPTFNHIKESKMMPLREGFKKENAEVL